SCEMSSFLKKSVTVSMDFPTFFKSIVALRQSLHASPEVSFKEFKTQERIKQFLITEAGIPEQDIRTCAGTGLVVDVQGPRTSPEVPVRCIALRADMDALPMTENNPHLNYHSTQHQAAHMCGHDGHMASLMSFSVLLNRKRDQLPPNTSVRLLFQPAEEGHFGAVEMIKDGCLNGVDEVYGYHNMPAPVGTLLVKPGPVMSHSSRFSIRISGPGGHGSAPHQTTDPIVAAGHIIVAMQSIVSRNVSAQDSAIISITQVHGGEADNVIPSSVVLSGTTRDFSPSVSEIIEQRMKAIVESTAAAFNVKGEFTFRSGYPVTFNTEAEANLVEELAIKALGKDNVSANGLPYAASEDFSYYLQERPGCFFFLGTNDENIPQNRTLHSDTFDFNDAILPIAARIFLGIVQRQLNCQLYSNDELQAILNALNVIVLNVVFATIRMASPTGFLVDSAHLNYYIESTTAAPRKANHCRYEGGCTKYAQAGGMCIAHGGGRLCTVATCPAYNTRTCRLHGGSMKCMHADCTNAAIGKLRVCCKHGGGRKCQTEGCNKYDAGKGFCLSHGGGRLCKHDDCPKKQYRQGFCYEHATKAMCRVEGCPRLDLGKGFCKTHGGGYTCKVEGCTKKDKGGGHCIAHGGGTRCRSPGCIKVNRGGGFCKAHGGGKKCQYNNCAEWVLGGGFCKTHGGGAGKRCSAKGCLKFNQGGGFCLSHGGGLKCTIEGCAKKQTRFGLCCTHGGKPRCKVAQCDKAVQTKGLCKAHGGIKPCSEPDCTRQAKSGGYCIAHGGGQKCKALNCTKTQRGGGYCKAHGGGQKCCFTSCTKWALHGGQCEDHPPVITAPLNLPFPRSAPFQPFQNVIHPALVQYSSAISILNPEVSSFKLTAWFNSTMYKQEPSPPQSAGNTLNNLLDTIQMPPFLYTLPSLRSNDPLLFSETPASTSTPEKEPTHRTTNRLQHQLNPMADDDDDSDMNPNQDAAVAMTALW
ncbi:amidohydrolase family protein, partial [Thraustotheca clavata]